MKKLIVANEHIQRWCTVKFFIKKFEKKSFIEKNASKNTLKALRDEVFSRPPGE
ncbi:Protein CBG25191 [Caenorhabditis briggsae]|uniref:Protein CBG25191 n=1 Tax=Caenorhabditis briggsae TaxID=6238 RepID=B6IM16_CAEBR|nr:Protein CBG25191 [Caenorhabditis briggsae]CAS00946.1 Protein CBG25191 [Caenorhabditis briggsae]